MSEYSNEDTLTKAVGEELIQLLEKHGYNVVRVNPNQPTSTVDSLNQRASQANNQDADLLVSIHFNKSENPTANGTEVFVLDNASDQTKEFASNVLKGFEEEGFKNRGVKSANFAVLRKSNMSSVLVECGFISNLGDMCKYDPYKIAENIFDAIKNVF